MKKPRAFTRRAMRRSDIAAFRVARKARQRAEQLEAMPLFQKVLRAFALS